MTHNEAYLYGYSYGLICSIPKVAEKYDHSGFKLEQAGQYPIKGWSALQFWAIREHCIDEDMNRRIAEIISHVDEFEESDFTQFQPPQMQMSFTQGYLAGFNGRPCNYNFGKLLGPDIAAARKKKGLTQQQLADLVGVSREQVARWESGSNEPGDASKAKLKEVLGQ